MNDLASSTPSSRPEGEETATRLLFSRVYSWFEALSKFSRFRNTRGRIAAGERLFDMSPEQRKQLLVMGPLGFNVYESVVAAFPSIVVLRLMNFFWPVEKTIPSADLIGPLRHAQLELIPTVSGYVNPLIIPMVLIVTALAAGWGSLKSADSTPEARKRARDAFLYFDGTYCLLPQALGVLSVSFVFALVARKLEFSPLYIMLALLLFVASWMQIYQTGVRIAKRLFELNGYSTVYPRLVKSRNPPNLGPWSKYQVSVLFLAGTAAWVLSFMAIALILAAAYLLAAIKVVASG